MKIANILIGISAVGLCIFSLYKIDIFTTSICVLFISSVVGGLKGRRKTKKISGGTTTNAAEELASLFGRATRTIDIVCASLNPEVYNNELVLDALENASKRGITIRVLTNLDNVIKNHSTTETKEKSVIDMIMEEKITMYSIKKDFNKINHFAVVDQGSFRIEEKHTQEDNKRENLVVYNDKKGRKLHEIFQKVIGGDKAQKINADELRNSLKVK